MDDPESYAHEGLELLDVGVAIFDKDTRLVFANRAFHALRRYPDDLCREGVTLEALLRFNAERGDFGPGDIEVQIADRLAEIDQAEEREIEREMADGQVLRIRYRRTASGGLVVTFDDRTDERRAQAKLALSEERHTLVSRATSDGIYDWNVTDDLLYVSDALSRLFNFDQGVKASSAWAERVHEGDLAGYLLEQGGWEHLDLPAIAEEPNTIELGKRGVIKRDVGHLLHPERLPLKLLDQRQSELGSYVFAAQYQQRPAPLGGGIVKWDWFHTYDVAPAQVAGDRIIQSWDTASKADEANDYSVCTTWLVRGETAWLLDVNRAKLEFPDLRKKIVALAKQRGSTLVLIEEAGSGIQLLQDLRTGYSINVKGIVPKDDKGTRLLSVSPMIEGGSISVPSDAPWLAAFQREITLFPNAKYDDQVDSLSQFLKWFAVSKPPTFTIRGLGI